MQFVSCKTQKEDLTHSSQILGKVGNEKGGDWKVWGGCAELWNSRLAHPPHTLSSQNTHTHTHSFTTLLLVPLKLGIPRLRCHLFLVVIPKDPMRNFAIGIKEMQELASAPCVVENPLPSSSSPSLVEYWFRRCGTTCLLRGNIPEEINISPFTICFHYPNLSENS